MELVDRLLGVRVRAAEPLGVAVTRERWRVRLADGRDVFAKVRADAPDGFFAAEARGLGWLAVPGGPPVPEVLGHGRELLVLPWLPEEAPAGVERFGRELAAYGEVAPPAAGWRERERLHQVHPLLVHAVLFGGHYLAAARTAAAAYL